MMSNRFIFFSQNVKRAVAGYDVTITVKEWFLDPDNSFTDTEVGALQYMTVKIGSETKQTNASGQVVFNLVDGDYTYEVYDNARYLTTYRDDFTVSGASQSIAVKCYACLYKPTEVWDMINNSSYVPVASGAELDNLRNTGARTMGAKTIFVGSYTTGINGKKYIQIGNIDLVSYTNWIPLGGASNITIEYEANDLFIINLTQNITSGVSGLIGLAICTVKNLTIELQITSSSTSSVGGISSASSGVGISLYENINVYGNIISTGTNLATGGICGSIEHISAKIINCNLFGYVRGKTITGGVTGTSIGIIDSCNNYAFVERTSTDTTWAGGIVGRINNTSAIITNCKNYGNVSCPNYHCGGIVGRFESGSVYYSENYGEIECIGSSSRVGGICGYKEQTSLISDCFNHGVIIGNTRTGGVCGWQALGTIINCYSIGVITANTEKGGLIGFNSGTITNSYYDKDTSGQSDTGKGLPRTTAQMQAGTANSYILPDGTTDPDSLPANAMYLNWDGNIWEFGDTDEYPTLK